MSDAGVRSPLFDLPLLPGASCDGEDPDLWFGYDSDHETVSVAVAICGECPVRQACAEWALRTGEAYGVWGGLTPTERFRLRRRDGSKLSVSERARKKNGQSAKCVSAA